LTVKKGETFCAETSVSNCRPQNSAGLNWLLVPVLLVATVARFTTKQQGHVVAMRAAGFASVLQTE